MCVLPTPQLKSGKKVMLEGVSCLAGGRARLVAWNKSLYSLSFELKATLMHLFMIQISPIKIASRDLSLHAEPVEILKFGGLRRKRNDGIAA